MARKNKKLLSEGQVTQFMKLANLGALTPGFVHGLHERSPQRPIREAEGPIDVSGMDVSVRDAAITALAADGGIVNGANKVRVHAGRFAKDGGGKDILEALL